VSAQAEEAQHSNDHNNQTHDIDNAVHIVLSLKLKKAHGAHRGAAARSNRAWLHDDDPHRRKGMLVIALASGGPDRVAK